MRAFFDARGAHRLHSAASMTDALPGEDISRGVFRRGAAILSWAALLLAAGEASASGDVATHYISLGILTGVTGHVDSAPVLGALGFEATYTHYPSEPLTFGIGAFLQAQSVGLDYARVATGAQFNYMAWGAELGAFVEEGSKEKATTFGLQVCPFTTLGFVSTALRIGISVATLSSGEKYGVDIGLIATVKWPLGLEGRYFFRAFGVGW